MGKPDSAADHVLPVANSAASNTANLTSSLKRARATGLDPGTALSSSFDFLNEHRLGIKVVAPEDRPLTDGDVPPAGFASPAVTEATTPSPCPVVEPALAPASAPASPTKRAARPATPPAPRSTPPPTTSAPRPTTRAARPPPPSHPRDASSDSANRTRRTFPTHPSSPTRADRYRDVTPPGRLDPDGRRPRVPRSRCSYAPRSVPCARVSPKRRSEPASINIQRCKTR